MFQLCHVSLRLSGWPAHLVKVGHLLHLRPCAGVDGSQDLHQSAQLVEVRVATEQRAHPCAGHHYKTNT